MNKHKEAIEEAFEEAFESIEEAFEILERCKFILWDSSEWREMLSGVVQKATPKKPVLLPLEGFSAEDASVLSCPCCKESITNVWSRAEYKPQYCHFCGQRLDWSDKNE